jgi:transglutaminase-like putative cysteine protease
VILRRATARPGSIRSALLAAVLVLAAWPAAAPAAPSKAGASSERADWTLVEEHFHALSLAGHPCGRTHERVERSGERVRTVSRIEMRFTRLGEETVIDLTSTFVESARGEPIEALVAQRGADTLRFVFEGSRKAWLERGDARELRELPDGDWLTPREVAAFVKARGEAKAGEIRYRTLDVQSGFVIAEIAMKRLGEIERGIDGRAVRLVRYEVRNSLQPVTATELYDAEGIVQESATPLGLGELLSRRVTRDEADAAYRGARFDLLAGTFISSERIADRAMRSALALEVEATAGDLIDLPDCGAQRFERTGPSRGIVRVEVGRGSAAEPGDRTDPRWMKAGELIDSDHPDVRALHASVRQRNGATKAERAEALRAAVARHLRAKNLATAFGSASEAARTRSGDCTEHAVLLAALLRIDGTPSRVASGLVYVPDLGGKGPGWGWHLWTQALLDESAADPSGNGGAPRAEWRDLDATLGAGDGGFHAGHLLVATSDLSGGASDPAFARALSLIGGVAIRVMRDAPEAPPERAR